MYERSLLEYKRVRRYACAGSLVINPSIFKMQAAEKKHPKEEKNIVYQLRPLDRLH